MSSDYLKVVICETFSDTESCHSKYRITPFAKTNNEIFYSLVKSAQKLTSGCKRVYKISLDTTDTPINFLPGDAIGVLPRNNEELVEVIFTRLNIEQVADKRCQLEITEGTTKKNPVLPKHLPPQSTLRKIFLYHVDIHTPPKKLFLKALSRFVQDPAERANLEQVCSPKASVEYSDLISTSCQTLLGFLDTFPSCRPPVHVLLENLPPLQARPYSISSSPLSGEIEITFFILEHQDGRKGTCTGWLEDIILQRREEKIPFYFRQPTNFRLPEDDSIPLILIATGTGFAPFRGFLQHRRINGIEDGEIWLFYGCRSDSDFLYKGEIEEYVRIGVIGRLDVAFSRSGGTYVQHKIDEKENEFYEWVSTRKSKIFICGNFKTVARDVTSVIEKMYVKKENMSDLEARNYVKEMVTVDSWI